MMNPSKTRTTFLLNWRTTPYHAPIILGNHLNFYQEEGVDLALLPSLNPKNATEALLLGQFLALQDSGMKCLRLANSQDMFYHIEKLFTLATKLFNTANQTMQSLTKYQSGGQQTVQVLHVHNEGQAVVAQNLTSQSGKGGSRKKNLNEPHGSL